MEYLSDDSFYFEERRETNGVKNFFSYDAPYLILIVKNERADKK